jgi:hypothetical protein
MTTEGHVEGKTINKIVFDIGATTSIMSEKIAKKHNFKINNSDAKVRVADDRIIDVVEETDKLMIDIKGHSCKLSFVVLNHNENDILLGIDYFNETGLGIYPKQRLLRFPDEEIRLPERCERDESDGLPIFLVEDKRDEVMTE